MRGIGSSVVLELGLGLGLALGAGQGAAQPATSAPVVAAAATDAGLEYTVQPRDTLIGLTRGLLVNPAAWPEVARTNALRNPNRIYPDQRLQIPLHLLRAADQPAELLSVTGQVQVDGQAAQAGMRLNPGQRLSSGAQSSARLRLGDGSEVKLLPGTEVVLGLHRRYALKAAQPDSEEGLWATAMRLLTGSVDVLASKLPRVRPLEVQTPTAVIGVRGTEYRVNHGLATEPASRTEVLEGRVRVSAGTGRPGAATDLAQAQGAVIRPGDTRVQARPLPPAPELLPTPALFERPTVRLPLLASGPATAGLSGLRVQVAADAAFEQIVRDQRVPVAEETRLVGLDDGVWHFRVRQEDHEGLAGPDTVRSFRLKARPEPPVMVAPRPAGKLPPNGGMLRWATHAEAATYRVEVAAADAAFDPVVWRSGDLSGGVGPLPALTPGRYQWRLRSVRADGDLGPWGDPAGFEVRPLPAEAQGGLSADGRWLSFKWTGEAGDRFDLQFARDPGFRELLAQAQIAETDWVVPTPTYPGDYYFRLRVIEGDGYVSPWSSAKRVDVPRDWSFLWYFAPLLLAF